MRKKISLIVLIIIAYTCLFSNFCFAGVDEVKLFISGDFGSNPYNITATNYAAATFRKLGYSVRSGPTSHPNYTVTSSRSDVLTYIQESGDNYAFYVNSHGAAGIIAMQNGTSAQCIYPSDITGGWHLVWIDACNCLSNTDFANAFHTIGYSNRASLGWFNTVYNSAIAEWNGHFLSYAGTMGLRDACLAAAGDCSSSTPIRIFGDTSWYGYAWP